jgi:hypothetical protein
LKVVAIVTGGLREIKTSWFFFANQPIFKTKKPSDFDRPHALNAQAPKAIKTSWIQFLNGIPASIFREFHSTSEVPSSGLVATLRKFEGCSVLTIEISQCGGFRPEFSLHAAS